MLSLLGRLFQVDGPSCHGEAARAVSERPCGWNTKTARSPRVAERRWRRVRLMFIKHNTACLSVYALISDQIWSAPRQNPVVRIRWPFRMCTTSITMVRCTSLGQHKACSVVTTTACTRLCYLIETTEETPSTAKTATLPVTRPTNTLLTPSQTSRWFTSEHQPSINEYYM